MVTKDDVIKAKEFWEEVKLKSALAIAARGTLREQKEIIILSLISSGFSKKAALKAFDSYEEDQQKVSAELTSMQNFAEHRYSKLDAKFREQKSESESS